MARKLWAIAAAFILGVIATAAVTRLPDTPARPVSNQQPTTDWQIPHCLVEDGGPQPVCIWDSAVDGNGLPAAPNNVVILFITQPGEDPVAHRIK